jgi:putative sterol carrier protein
MDTNNVSEIMKAIPSHFNAEKAKGVSALIQCIFTGEQASEWVVTIKDQTCNVEEGKADSPDLTLKANSGVLTDVLSGKMDPMRAFLLGKVKVSGDIGLGMKLMNLIR